MSNPSVAIKRFHQGQGVWGVEKLRTFAIQDGAYDEKTLEKVHHDVMEQRDP